MSNLLPPAPDTRHPEWCDPEYCELLQPQRLSEHRSRPIVIERAEMFPETISTWLSQFAFEPPETAVVYISVRFERAEPNGELVQVSTHSMRLDQAAQLAVALTELAKRGEDAQRGDAR
jgi:hypothetical protein